MLLCCLATPSRRTGLLATAIFCLLTGSFMLAFKDWIFSTIINSQLVVREGTASYNAWKETPIPVFTKFYFFDMVNPRELFHSKEMPILVEQGPYTFREVEKKVNVSWHGNGTVSYRRMKHWFFEPSMSVGPLTDTVTTINVPVVGSAEFARGDFLKEWGISDMLSTIETDVFVTKTVGELLFEGYADTVMEIGSSMNGETPGAEEEEDFFGEDFYMGDEAEEGDKGVTEKATVNEDSNPVVMDKFGWFYKRNGTSWSDGSLLMETGVSDISRLGRIQTWNHSNRTEAYPGSCGQVRGSADGLFPPSTAFLTDTISIYSTDLCRPLQFTRASDQDVHDIPVVKFKLAEDSFSNSTVCPGNSCYNNNLHNGVQNVTQCKVKSPAFVSRPHFHLADRFYQEQFQYGIQPDPSLHDSSFWLEPHSSIPVRVEMRLQLNILLEKVPGIEYLFKDLQRVMFPVLWFDSTAEVPKGMASSLYLLVMLPTMFQVSGIISLLVGAVLLGLFCCYKIQEVTVYKALQAGKASATSPSTDGYLQVPAKELER